MSEATTLEAGYLLHYTPWRDTSFIVDAFTLAHGRVGLMARGARGAKPATRALYQPFRPLLFSWMGEGELHTLVGIEESGAAIPLDGAALASAYYLNELVLRLLGKEQPVPELFAHYALALSTLAGDGAAGAPLEGTLRTFELQLLEATGVLPDLTRCTPDGRTVEARRRYRFHPGGAVAVPIERDAGNDGADAAGLAIPKRAPAPPDGVAEPGVHADGVTPDTGVEVAGRTLLDMAALDFSDASTREEAKALMRRLVAEQLGGRPLKSRSMFQALVPPPPSRERDESGESGVPVASGPNDLEAAGDERAGADREERSER